MDDELYRQLGEEPDTDLSWGLLREFIGRQLLGDEFVTVPYLSSADCFNQLFAFVKTQKFLEVLVGRPPTYKVIGNLDFLIDYSRSTYFPEFDVSTWDVADSQRFDSNFQYRIVSEGQNVEKEIKIMVRNCHARSVSVPTPGSVAFDLTNISGMKKVRKIYIITEVVYTPYMQFMVRIGDRENYAIFNHTLPIGMKYRKFRVGSNGALLDELVTTLKYSDVQGRWIPPTLWLYPRPIDSAGRKSKNVTTWGTHKRHPKNNLTVLSPSPNKNSKVRS